MNRIALGLAAAGVAAIGFGGAASAAESPQEIAAVNIMCWDLGYDHHDCNEAVEQAVVLGVESATNAGLAGAGVDYVVELGL